MQKSTFIHKNFINFVHLYLEIYHDEHRLLRKIAHHRDEKNHPNYLFINSYVLNLHINEVVDKLYKIISIIQRSKSNKDIMRIQQGIKGAHSNHGLNLRYYRSCYTKASNSKASSS